MGDGIHLAKECAHDQKLESDRCLYRHFLGRVFIRMRQERPVDTDLFVQWEVLHLWREFHLDRRMQYLLLRCVWYGGVHADGLFWRC